MIVSAVRTPFGRLGGGLAGYEATQLGAFAIKAALERIGLEPHEPQYAIMGQVLQGGAGQAPARQAAIGAGLPKETPADTINKVCASSIRAIEIADSMIRAGDVDVVVTGGMESMSNAPYLLKKARFGYRLGDGELIDSMVYDGLTSTFDQLHMVAQNSKVARELGISREQQDEWAARSQARAAARRMRAGSTTRSSPSATSTADESIRRDTTVEKLAALKPVFDPEGTTTAGNAPGVNDGASCVIVCSEAWAKQRGLEPLATILSQGYVADDFAYLARTPANAGAIALERAGKSIGDVDRVEINEAFASVAWNSTRLLGADEEQVNVNGGAIALGHPIGASGGRIVGTMVHELRRNGGGLGLAAICSGGGQGDALLIAVRLDPRRRRRRGARRPGARRPPAALRRLVAAEREARAGRDVGGGRAARGPGGDRPRVHLGAPRSARTTTPTAGARRKCAGFAWSRSATGSRDGEVDELRWVKTDEALGLLVRRRERELLGRL